MLRYTKLVGSAVSAAAKSLQSCPTLCDPIDGSPPGSTIPGIFQARVLEWVAIAFSAVEGEGDLNQRQGIERVRAGNSSVLMQRKVH